MRPPRLSPENALLATVRGLCGATKDKIICWTLHRLWWVNEGAVGTPPVWFFARMHQQVRDAFNRLHAVGAILRIKRGQWCGGLRGR